MTATTLNTTIVDFYRKQRDYVRSFPALCAEVGAMRVYSSSEYILGREDAQAWLLLHKARREIYSTIPFKMRFSALGISNRPEEITIHLNVGPDERDGILALMPKWLSELCDCTRGMRLLQEEYYDQIVPRRYRSPLSMAVTQAYCVMNDVDSMDDNEIVTTCSRLLTDVGYAMIESVLLMLDLYAPHEVEMFRHGEVQAILQTKPNMYGYLAATVPRQYVSTRALTVHSDRRLVQDVGGLTYGEEFLTDDETYKQWNLSFALSPRMLPPGVKKQLCALADEPNTCKHISLVRGPFIRFNAPQAFQNGTHSSQHLLDTLHYRV